MALSDISHAVSRIAQGGLVVVVDDEERENEGDLIMAAERATPETVAFMIRHTSGIICAPAASERLDALGLPMMVEQNSDPLRTAFTVSADYVRGMTTGVSAEERARTLNALADEASTAGDFVRPGHVFPLRYRAGGVLVRSGHTEAAVDLCRLAGLKPVGALAELNHDDGTMMPMDAGHDAGPPEMDAGHDAGPPPMSTLFGPCTIDEQCPGGEGAFCRKPEEGWPMGYCTLPCEDRGPCDDGVRYNHCLEQSDGSGMFCEQRCENGVDCERDGYTCVGEFSGGTGMCVGVCSTDEQCGEGAECNPWNGECVAEGEVPTDGSETGGPCDGDDGCRSGNCIQGYDMGTPTGWTDGYCIGNCILPVGYNTNTFYRMGDGSEELPQAGCPDTDVCYPGYGSYTRGDIGVCLQECSTDADCRAMAGYTCRKEFPLASGGTSTYTNGVCFPINCRDTPCPDGMTCRSIPTSRGTLYVCERT